MEVQKHLHLLLIAFLVFQLGQTTSVAGEDFIRRCCRSSKYPDLCYSSLSHFAGQVGQDAGKLASVSTSFCLSKVQPLKAYISGLKTTDPKLGQSLKQCMENFGEALDNIQKSEKRLKDAKSGIVISDVQTWMSAALTDLDTCVEGFKNVPDGPVKKDVVNRTSEVEKFNSIALALINVYAQT
ncbi:Plant invertase/pectin methylesterase inhibitor superfamily protein [Euphorbia peplus]|nr:Plant invertase/pectin methylesterase inhibitor superfamily protein [Euphorbia peplus]